MHTTLDAYEVKLSNFETTTIRIIKLPQLKILTQLLSQRCIGVQRSQVNSNNQKRNTIVALINHGLLIFKIDEKALKRNEIKSSFVY